MTRKNLLKLLLSTVTFVSLYGVAFAIPTSTTVQNLIVNQFSGSGTKCVKSINGLLATSTADCGSGSGGATTTINQAPEPFNFTASSTNSVLSIASSTSGGSSTIQFVLNLAQYLTTAIQTLAGLSTSTINLATSTQSGVFTYTASGNTITFTIPPASDYLASSTTYVSSFNGATGAITGVNSISGNGCVSLNNTTGTIAITSTCLSTSTGLTVANFATSSNSQWANDAGYITTSTYNVAAQACGGTDKVSAISATGTITCTTDGGGAGGVASTTPFTVADLVVVSSSGALSTISSSTYYLSSNPNNYISSAPATTTITASGVATGNSFTFATSGPLMSIACSTATCTFTTIPTSTILAGYATSTGVATSSQGIYTRGNVSIIYDSSTIIAFDGLSYTSSTGLFSAPSGTFTGLLTANGGITGTSTFFWGGNGNVSGTLTILGSLVSTSTGANPTASVGLTAVNGTANTFMRSDGSPALSQTITPVWTGLHQFSGAGASTTQLWSSSTSFPGFGNAIPIVSSTSKLVPLLTQTCTGTDKVSALSATGTITCSADSGGSGGGGGLSTSTLTVSVSSTLGVASSTFINVNASSSAITITLPSSQLGLIFDIMKMDTSTNPVSITGSGGQKIYANSQDLTTVDINRPRNSITVQGDGTGWYIRF